MSHLRVEVTDVQGITLFGYASLPVARYLVVALSGGAPSRAWLSGVVGEVQSARKEDRGPVALNVAFTARGLARLGLPRAALATFPREIQQGMGTRERARILRDTGRNAPESWELGGPGNPPIDALLLLYASDETSLSELAWRHRAHLARTAGGAILGEEEAYIDDSSREHFGFHDGISNPHVLGCGRRSPPASRGDVAVPPGEFVLGYPNAHGQIPPSPTVPGVAAGDRPFDLGKNGSYLVYRKLEQDVAGFWRFMHDHAAPSNGEGRSAAATALAARMVGRWPGGAPVVMDGGDDARSLASANDFGFAAEDPDGMKCPFGSHIRRANPRDMLGPSPEVSLSVVRAHRLSRRGRLYGPRLPGPFPREDDGERRGLHFIALCASVRRQFEFVQQTWVTNPAFAGLHGETDPLLGVAGDGGRAFTVPRDPVRQRICGLPQFVTVRGGGYFFVPGLRALAYLAEGLDPSA